MHKLTAVVLIASALLCAKASAQNKISSEFGAGVSVLGLGESTEVPSLYIIDMSSNIAPMAYGELKYNHSEHLDFDVQVAVTYGTGKAKYAGDRVGEDGNTYKDYQQMNYTGIGTSLLGIAEWNFAPSSSVNPYIGAGAGLGYGHFSNTLNNQAPNTITLVPVVRAGLEFSDKFRIALTYRKFLKDGPFYSNLGISLGWSFGI